MGKNKYSKVEQQVTTVLKYQDDTLNTLIDDKNKNAVKRDAEIELLEEQLRVLGIDTTTVKKSSAVVETKKVMVVPSWERLCREAELTAGTDCKLESLFTDEELKHNERAINKLNAEYNQICHLDNTDIAISAIAGIAGAAVDILLVGIPAKGPEGLEAGPLSNFIRKKFDEAFPASEMEKLANSKGSKVPFDAQDNRHTKEYVTGLSAYYHRLLSLGHDPLLGFVVGIFDIITGRMTTIDKNGKIVSQIMDNYDDRKASDVFEALAKLIIHYKSDINTYMGLPAPLMALFNLLQFGSIGEEEQTIAEIVQGMYYEGYDFIHFCSLSIPVMLTEVIVRLLYAFKRIKEGFGMGFVFVFRINAIQGIRI